MKQALAPRSSALAQRNEARLSITIGRRSRVAADVTITSSGLLAIGGLVSMILLSTAVIVKVAKRRDR